MSHLKPSVNLTTPLLEPRYFTTLAVVQMN